MQGNTGAGLLAGNVTEDLKKAEELAEVAIDSGRAKTKMNQLVEISRQLGQS